MHLIRLAIPCLLSLGASLTGQTPTDVLTRSTVAVGYPTGVSSRVGLKGTELMPHATGTVSVRVKPGYTQIDATFTLPQPPRNFGSEFLTYVLWAVSPEGRSSNLGEVLTNKSGSGRLKVSSPMQTFSLFVTAEPYFGVRLPSEVVVLENEVLKETRGKRFPVQRYTLMKRGRYQKLANPLSLSPDLKAQPLDIYEARNALAIAQRNGADRYAAEIFEKAAGSLKMAENTLRARGDRRQVIAMARQTVQFSEDALTLAIQRQEEERGRNERQARETAERQARERTQQEAVRRAQAEAAAARAEAAEARAQAARQKAERETQLRAQAEADRHRARQAQAEAEQRARKAEDEKVELRSRLLQQFSMVLETRDTERGLVVNMPDVLFDSGKYTLRPEAREKLARIAGIVINYPKLRLEAEGHTDNVGSPRFNLKLSEQRADETRRYLVSQGVPIACITWVGRGYDVPIASNETAAGRKQNRRVELIVSGEVIGTVVGRSAR